MTRIELLKKLIDNNGKDFQLPKVYAELFSVGELLDLCEAQENARRLFDPRTEAQKELDDAAQDWQAQVTEYRG